MFTRQLPLLPIVRRWILSIIYFLSFHKGRNVNGVCLDAYRMLRKAQSPRIKAVWHPKSQTEPTFSRSASPTESVRAISRLCQLGVSTCSSMLDLALSSGLNAA